MIDLFGKQDAKKDSTATQKFVEVKEIREGVVILKSGGMRMLLEVSSINFALKSTDEQTAIIIQFQDFLNSLDFSIQIVINSRKLDIEPYLNILTQIASKQTNELLRVQTQEYTEFIRNMVASQNIMNKKFYLVIPYERVTIGGKSLTGKSAQDAFIKDKSQLLQRADHAALGLRRLGLIARLIESEGILNLLTQLYHPTIQIKEMNLPTMGLADYS